MRTKGMSLGKRIIVVTVFAILIIPSLIWAQDTFTMNTASGDWDDTNDWTDNDGVGTGGIGSGGTYTFFMMMNIHTAERWNGVWNGDPSGPLEDAPILNGSTSAFNQEPTTGSEPGKALLWHGRRGVDDLPVEEVEMAFVVVIGQSQTTAETPHLKPLQEISEMEPIETALDHRRPVYLFRRRRCIRIGQGAAYRVLNADCWSLATVLATPDWVAVMRCSTMAACDCCS